MEAQSAALQAQQEILENGEELKVTLRDSAEGSNCSNSLLGVCLCHLTPDPDPSACRLPSGLRTVFLELSSTSREQQVALSELFNRVSFLQNFLLMEAHSLSSCCYNGGALCTAYLLTSTQRSSRAR